MKVISPNAGRAMPVARVERPAHLGRKNWRHVEIIPGYGTENFSESVIGFIARKV
jgi:hypothetical protein